MQFAVCLFALPLSGCGVSSSLLLAPIGQPAGYPVFIKIDQGGCNFQVQDMILKSRGLADWMTQLPDKSWQIDLVRIGERHKCAEDAAKIVRSAGFTSLMLRRNGDAEYPGGLPPI